MIVTEIYNGQGLGNQLWCYVTTRVIALDKGFDFGIQSPEKLKCNEFMKLDYGKTVIGGSGPEGGPPHQLPEGIQHYYNERRINHPKNGVDIRTYDQNLVDIPDNTKIDGIMQDEEYILHRKAEIRTWLKVKPEYECNDYADDNTCVINFRGGEYVQISNVFLPQSYWDTAIEKMREINPKFRFVVITDDVVTAKKFFPNYKVFHFSIAKDYAILNSAYYLILSNSSFACFPTWLNVNLKFCIAPKYWSQYNTSDGFWGCSYNMIKGWYYLNREGRLEDYDTCKSELAQYQQSHQEYFAQVKIKTNFLVVSNYYNDLSWVPEYTNNYLIYDQSDSKIYPPKLNQSKVIKSPHLGHNIRDYCTFIIDHYDALPDITIFATGNIFPRHVPREIFDKLMNNGYFTPIEDYRKHRVYWPICFLSSDGGFCEINNSWYLNESHPTKYFHSYNDFIQFCFVNPVIPRYIRFAPGANYIVPRANILKLPKVFYQNLRLFVSHCSMAIPGESHIIERALHTIWNAPYVVNKKMYTSLNESFLGIRKTNEIEPSLKQKFLNKARILTEALLKKLS